MKKGKCPICNSSEVYANETINFRASGQLVDLEDETGNADPEFYFIPYICMKCGFAAMFVEDMDEIKDLPEIEGWEGEAIVRQSEHHVEL